MRIACLGDLCITSPVKIAIDEKLKATLSSCDYRIANFEGPVDGEKENYIPKSGPRLKQPSSVITLLKELKIDALTLANNHIMDENEEGLAFSKKILSDYNLIGAGNWEDAYRPLRIELGG